MRRLLPFACLLATLLFSIPLFAQEEGGDAPIYVIPLRGDVDRQLGVFLAQSLQTAQDAGASIVIFEIDTFGGRVDTALEIAGRIGTTDARTIAYIPAGGRGVSWSAGALMAFSCSEIWMAPGTSMGAAAPVYQTTEGMQSAEEKTVSAVRGQMAALAEKNGHPEAVALAMVDADVVLKEVVVNGESLLATGEDIEAFRAQGSGVEEGRILCDAGKLLTLTAGQMERYGVASGLADNREDLVSALGFDFSQIIEEEPSGADSFVAFLTSAGVTGILLAVGLVALYLEITSPGFGIPGTIALLCFALVFWGQWIAGQFRFSGNLDVPGWSGSSAVGDFYHSRLWCGWYWGNHPDFGFTRVQHAGFLLARSGLAMANAVEEFGHSGLWSPWRHCSDWGAHELFASGFLV